MDKKRPTCLKRSHGIPRGLATHHRDKCSVPAGVDLATERLISLEDMIDRSEYMVSIILQNVKEITRTLARAHRFQTRQPYTQSIPSLVRPSPL